MIEAHILQCALIIGGQNVIKANDKPNTTLMSANYKKNK